jgi:flagellar basal-body rod protein FlgC
MRIGTLTNALQASSSGLTAERFRMDTISSNIANARIRLQRKANGYRRRSVVLSATENGVRIDSIHEDFKTQFHSITIHRIQKQYVNSNVKISNVEPTMEMVDMISASCAYEANIAAFNTVKEMINLAETDW